MYPYPLQKISPPENLRLCTPEPAFEVQETAPPPWAALRAARERYAISDSSFIRTPGQGFGPQFSGSKPDVLPLDDPGNNKSLPYTGESC